eukprot:UN07246
MCDQNIDDCVGHGCVNGTCVDGLESYTCECDVGYEGDMCDQAIATDNCADNGGCVHGTCVDEGDSYSCNCLPYYEGEMCDIPVEAVFNDVGSGFVQMLMVSLQQISVLTIMVNPLVRTLANT